MDNRLVFDNQFLPVVWELLMSARSTIDLCFYKAELPDKTRKKKLNLIYGALSLKRKEGVRVRVLLNKEQPIRGVSRYNVVVADYLKEKNIYCRYLGNFRCCHSKIILVDSSSFYVGSHNLSSNAMSRNFETGIICTDSVSALELGDRIKSLWDSAADFS